MILIEVLFFKNLSEESKTLFGGMVSRMFCTAHRNRRAPTGPRTAQPGVASRMFCTCALSLHQYKDLDEVLFFENLTEESRSLFGGMVSRMFFTAHRNRRAPTGPLDRGLKPLKAGVVFQTVQSWFNSLHGNMSKFLLKRVDPFLDADSRSHSRKK